MNKIFIVGGCNVDIQGRSNDKLINKDSNIGIISYSFGGVGRNIAENLALLNEDVYFISAFGNDPYGIDMYDYCLKTNINLDYSLKLNHSSSTYLAILNHDGDMEVAINDMRILDLLHKDVIDNFIKDINENDKVVLETNLNEELIDYIFAKVNNPIYVDPISINKANKVIKHFNKISLFKPNLIEAMSLSKIKVNNNEDEKRIVKYFLDQGIKKIVISMGKDGVIAGENDRFIKIKHPLIKMVNATGAGDAFLSGIVHYLNKDIALDKAIEFGVGCSMITINSIDTVSKDINEDNVLKLIKNMKMEIINEKIN